MKKRNIATTVRTKTLATKHPQSAENEGAGNEARENEGASEKKGKEVPLPNMHPRRGYG